MSGRHGKKQNNPKQKTIPSPAAEHIEPRTQIAEAKPEQALQRADVQESKPSIHVNIIRKPDPFDIALWGLFLTFVIAAIYFFQLRSMQNQQRSMQQQVLEMQTQTTEARKQTEISERPWLSVQVAPNSDVFFVDDNGGKYAGWGLKFTIKNLGKSIAKNVQIDVKYSSSSPGIPVALTTAKVQNDLCDHPKPTPAGWFDVFPAENPIERELSSSAPKADIDSMAQIINPRSAVRRRVVELFFVGCVTYGSSFEKGVHQTRFAYHLLGPQIRAQDGKSAVTLSDGTPLLMGFEVGVKVPKDKVGVMQEIFAHNDAN